MRGQRKESVQGVWHPVKLHLSPRAGQRRGVRFTLIAQWIIFRRDDQGARLPAQVAHEQRRKVWVLHGRGILSRIQPHKLLYPACS